MDENTILTSGGMRPTTINTPLDERERVQTKEDIFAIDNPYVGMVVYVVDEGVRYTVKSLKPKEIGGIEIPDAAVDEIIESSEEISVAKKMKVDSETGTLYVF